ncbi:MAG: hypothetical protein LUD01_00475 [Clostridiales bacterium]|nr:hypothetical protein [Clostridiales bacterium]
MYDEHRETINISAEEGKRIADEYVLPYLGEILGGMLSDFFAAYLSDADEEKQREILDKAIKELDRFSGHEEQEEIPDGSLLERYEEAADRTTDRVFKDMESRDFDIGGLDEAEQLKYMIGNIGQHYPGFSELSPSLIGELYGFVKEIADEVVSRVRFEENLSREIMVLKVMGVVSIVSAIAGLAIFVAFFLPESLLAGTMLAAILQNGAMPVICYLMVMMGVYGKILTKTFQDEKQKMLNESKALHLSETKYAPA